MLFQILSDCKGIGGVTLAPEGQSLETLKEEESRKGRQARSYVTQELRPNRVGIPAGECNGTERTSTLTLILYAAAPKSANTSP